ncbi:MAG: dephospho-CoA kinase, partial [Nitrospirota bacterium]
ADKLVHQILKKPSTIKKLAAIIGKGILIERAAKTFINKKRMADIIFNDVQKRKSVEKLIHPEVMKAAKDFKTKILAKKSDAIIVFEVPLLLEAGYEKIFDKIIVVYCSKEIAVNRVLRHGLSRKQALQRMRAQLPISRKKAAADFLINNNLSISNTKSQVKEIFKKIS